MQVTTEYKSLLAQKQHIEAELRTLPAGYLSKKHINGTVHHYLQRRIGNKIVSTYIPRADVAKTAAQITLRKSHLRELSAISARVNELEKAARLLGKNVYCEYMVYKLSVGMDTLSDAEKRVCASFGSAMNAIEGVAVSAETAADLAEWQNGTKPFCAVFESTLRRYGFPMER